MNNKWIKLATVVDVDLGQFVGFANNSMTFRVKETDEDVEHVRFVPLDQASGTIEPADCPCSWCLKEVSVYDPPLPEHSLPCPHVYFCAWNNLLCLSPFAGEKLFEILNDSCDSERHVVMTEYYVQMYSAQKKEWATEVSLDVPGDHTFHDDETRHPLRGTEIPSEVRHATFKIINMDSQVLIVMLSTGEGDKSNFWHKFLTVMQLTLDAPENLKSEVIFHKKIEQGMAKFFRRANVASLSGKLRFHKVVSRGSQTMEQIVEVDLNTSKIKELKPEKSVMSLPESGYDEYKTEPNTLRFVTSALSGHLYFVDNKLPYMNALWLYDPVLEKWRRLPGAPRDEDPSDIGMQLVPEAILPRLKSMPPALFEDGHDDIQHGPFYGHKFHWQ